MRDDDLIKYPSTPHLEGSRLQKGDRGDNQLRLNDLAGRYIVAEEKMDGANSGISFSPEGELRLQSRGHFLTGGAKEKHFNLLKKWAVCHEEMLFDTLSDRYIMYGEWMYAKHSLFYNSLPHYFLEFDLYDKQEQCFLSTAKRQHILAPTPIVSVPIWHQGLAPTQIHDFLSMITASVGRDSQWREKLKQVAEHRKLNVALVEQQTDQNEEAEGLYIKIEEGDRVISRCKFIRSSFTQTILDQEMHWHKRPIIPNQLKEGQDIYAPSIDKSWPQQIRLVKAQHRRKIK